MVNGDVIRAARGLLGLSQDELASLAGVARKTVATIEQGRGMPQMKKLLNLQKTLEAEGIEFLYDGGEAVGVKKRRKDGALPW